MQNLRFWPKGCTGKKFTCVSSLSSFLCPRFLTSSYLHFFNHVSLLSSFLHFMFPSAACFPPLLLHSFSLTFSFHSLLPALIFFHYFIPFFTSSSLSLPLALSLLPLRLLVSQPTARRPVRFHPLPRKRGLKFKAAVVDWRQEREHRRRPGLGQNRFKYHLK